MYQEGLGVPQDASAALTWFVKAARGKHIMAQYHLGKLYYDGIIVEKNIIQAYAWIGIVAASGYKPAEALRDEIESRMTREERKKAYVLAKELWESYGLQD